jgi:hypothetical protein
MAPACPIARKTERFLFELYAAEGAVAGGR